MQMRNKILATIIAVLLISSMAISLVAIQPASAGLDSATSAAKAAGMKWDFPGSDSANASSTRLMFWNRWKDHVPTWVFLSAAPNPVGVGQQITFLMFNPQLPNAPSSDKWKYSLDITAPNGAKEVLPPAGASGIYNQAIDNGKYVADTTGAAWATWTPTQVGNYSIIITFYAVEHTAYASSSDLTYYGVTYDSSTYTVELTVQQDQVQPTGWTPVPLPTEYWSRPIEGQNTDWWQVSSNWLNNCHDADNGGSDNKFQRDGIAPNSGHILWTKSTEDGGVVGGGNFSVQGEAYNAGHQYQTRFDGNQIMMAGRLYYRESNWYSGSGGDYVCVDLQTGQEIWRNRTMSAIPSFGYFYDFDDMNQHGVVEPTWLFSSNYGTAIHPRLGITGFSVTNVPSGTAVYGPKGEELRYAVTSVGNSTNPAYVLTQWNSSRVFISTTSGTYTGNTPITPARPTGTSTRMMNYTDEKRWVEVDRGSTTCSWNWNGTAWWYTSSTSMSRASLSSTTATAYDWNVTLPVTFSNSPSIRGAIFNDVLLVSNGSLPSAPSYTYAEEATFWGFSLVPGQVGQKLWGPTNIKLVTEKNQNLDFQRAAEGVFVFQVDPDMSWIAYDMHTGNKLWDSMAYPESDDNTFAYYISSTGYNPSGNAIAYGKLFSTGYVGYVYCYDLRTGELLWKQAAPTGMEKFEYYTLMIGAIADGKIYIGTHEHSADSPLFKGAKVRCYNVTDGTPIWQMAGWANPHTVQVADGVLTYWNNYDAKVYAVGKGPSDLHVAIDDDVVQSGESVMIKGNIIDISAGTQQKEQAARFPDGVPAVSDASQSDWMAYVYMQKQRPLNATGVPVTLNVVDANGNYREIGTATSDADGFFSYAWMPDIAGKYTVYASFGGSESYWPSHAVTAFNVDPAPATPTPAPTPIASVADTYFVPAIAALFVVIVAIGVVTMLMVRKRP